MADISTVTVGSTPYDVAAKKMNMLGRKTTTAAIALNPSVDTGFKYTWHISDSTSRTNDADGSPSFDSAILNFPWDWGAYNGQIAIGNTGTARMQIRSASHVDNGSSANPRYTPSYSAWRDVVTSTKNTAVGGTTQPVYIDNSGQATAISYTIAKSVPSNALFTDTNTWRGIQDNLTSSTNTTESLSAKQGYLLANGSARDNTKLPLTGGTLTGNLTVGTTSQSAAPTAGISVHDTRSYAWTPTSLSKGVNWFFSNNAMPDGNWWAGMSLHGWTGDYTSWQLVGPAHSADQRTAPLYVRTGRTTNGWGSWRKIYDTSNKPTYSDVGAAAASHGHGVNTASAYNSITTTAACATALNTTSVNSTTGTTVTASKATVEGSKLILIDVTASKVTTTATTVATSIKTTANAITALGTGTFATSVKNS